MLAVVVVFIGLLLIINSLAGWIFTYNVQALPIAVLRAAVFGSRYLSAHEIGMIGVTLVTLLLVYRVLPLHAARPCHAGGGAESGCRAGWSAFASAGCWRSAGGSPARSARSPRIMVAPIVYIEPNMMAGILLYGFAGGAARRHRQSVGRGVGGFIVGVHREPRSAPMWSAPS